MDLADELLLDLEGDEQVEEEEVPQNDAEEAFAVPSLPASATISKKRKASEEPAGNEDSEMLVDLPEGGQRPAEELDADAVEEMDLLSTADVSKVAKLFTQKSFQDALAKIKEYKDVPPSDMSTSQSAEYQLIVQSNNFAVEIDNEMLLVHKFVRDHYAPRFAELEQLVPLPSDYCRAVTKIGNPEDLAGLQDRLQGFVPQATLMVVVVTASTNTGRQLTPKEWKAVQQACDMCFKLDIAKMEILDYVESRITGLAPNLSAIIGARTATKILGMAGGLHSLSRQPSCNMHLFGAAKRISIGLSTGSHSSQRRGAGFIYNSPLLQSIPEEYRMKAQRTVAAKCVLAVRMDCTNPTSDAYGRGVLVDLEKKLEKLQEPPPSKVIKALPVPREGPTKRRGGKKARKAKEAYAMTELRKLQNRMAFGQEEEEDFGMDETKGLGMIGSSSGRIRASGGEAKSKAKLSKMNKTRLEKLKGPAGGTVSGLSSSLAFTPVQGMELVDPSAQKRKLEAANEAWFKNEASGSFSVVPGKKKLIQ